jgi:hypothetical protein
VCVLQLIGRNWRFVGSILPIVQVFTTCKYASDGKQIGLLQPLAESTFLRLSRLLVAAIAIRTDDAVECLPALIAAIRGM